MIVSWKMMKRWMFAYSERPHSTAFTTLANESSSRMIAAASFAIAVPVLPIAMPTSALFSAGASLVPSPVTATTSPERFSARTSLSLSSGRARAMIFSLRPIRTASSSSSAAYSRPVRISPSPKPPSPARPI